MADPAFNFIDLLVGSAYVVRWLVRGVRQIRDSNQVAQRLAVRGECNHYTQSAVVGATDPVDPHLLVGHVIPCRPIGEVRPPGGIVGRVFAYRPLNGMDDGRAKSVSARVVQAPTAVRRMIVPEGLGLAPR